MFEILVSASVATIIINILLSKYISRKGDEYGKY